MHKIVSYLFLCVGVLIILFSLNAMYGVFIQGSPVRELVHMASLTVQTQAGPLSIPVDAVNTVANMGLFSLFMLFVMAVGGKLASIGVQLLKNERIYQALLQLQKGEVGANTLKKL